MRVPSGSLNVPGFPGFTFTTGAKRLLWIHHLAGFMHGTDLARDSVPRNVTDSRVMAGARTAVQACVPGKVLAEWRGKVPACQALVVRSLSESPEILGAVVEYC